MGIGVESTQENEDGNVDVFSSWIGVNFEIFSDPSKSQKSYPKLDFGFSSSKNPQKG